MTQLNRWGLAAGLAAALVFAGSARAQGTQGAGTGTQPSPGAAGASGSSAAGQEGSAGATTEKSPGATTEKSPGATTEKNAADTAAAGTGSTGSATATTASSGKLSKDLQEGLQKLHAENEAEIEMGQMGAQMAQNEQVKQFAQKIADDHQKNDQKLTQIAQQAGVDLNGKPYEKKEKSAKKEMEKLHSKSGADFDKAFMSAMVKDHEKDVKEVGSLAKKAHKQNQTELASFLDQTHAAMQSHLELAQQTKKVEKETRQGRRGSNIGRSGTAAPPSGPPSGDTSAGSRSGSGPEGTNEPQTGSEKSPGTNK